MRFSNKDFIQRYNYGNEYRCLLENTSCYFEAFKQLSIELIIIYVGIYVYIVM